MQGLQNAKFLLEQGVPVSIAYRNSGNLGDVLTSKLAGFETNIFSFGSHYYRARTIFGKVIQTIRDPWEVLRSFFWGISVLRRENPSVIHVNNGGYPGAAGSRGFAMCGILFSKARIIFTVNNQAVPYSRPSRWPQFIWDLGLARSRTNWVTGSKNAARTLQQVLRLKSGLVSSIHNGPEPSCSCGDGEHRNSLKPANELIGLQIGHLEPRKGQEVLIEAIRHLQHQSMLLPNWVFVIEGEGQSREALSKKIEDYGLQEQIRMIGRAKCVVHLFLESDVYLHPSVFNDDLPNVVSEAMSFGLPIIASEIAGLPEQVSQGVSGILVPPADHKKLAEGIYSLMSSEELRSAMGEQSAKRYEKYFSKSVAVKAFADLYFASNESAHD